MLAGGLVGFQPTPNTSPRRTRGDPVVSARRRTVLDVELILKKFIGVVLEFSLEERLGLRIRRRELFSGRMEPIRQIVPSLMF